MPCSIHFALLFEVVGQVDRRHAALAQLTLDGVAAFEGCEHIILNKPSGAFYFTVMFKDGVLGNDQVLDIADTGIRATIE